MTATYSLFRNPVPEEKANEGKLHARLVNQEIVRIDRLVKEISDMSSFSSADVKGLLEAFRSRLELHLENGAIVDLEGLGTFSVSLKCPPLANEKKIVPGKVSFSKVNFRCSKELKEKLEFMTVERSKEGSRLKGLSAEKRKERILEYLKNGNTISSFWCRGLNGCSKYIALKDLQELVKEGKIIRLGVRQNAQYGLSVEGE